MSGFLGCGEVFFFPHPLNAVIIMPQFATSNFCNFHPLPWTEYMATMQSILVSVH
jgi:hypothetical protein